MSPEALELLLKGMNPSSLAETLKQEYQSDNPNKQTAHSNEPVKVFWPDDNSVRRNVTNTTKK